MVSNLRFSSDVSLDAYPVTICVILVKSNSKGIANLPISVVNLMHFYFAKYFVILLDKKLSLIETL